MIMLKLSYILLLFFNKNNYFQKFKDFKIVLNILFFVELFKIIFALTKDEHFKKLILIVLAFAHYILFSFKTYIFMYINKKTTIWFK